MGPYFEANDPVRPPLPARGDRAAFSKSLLPWATACTSWVKGFSFVHQAAHAVTEATDKDHTKQRIFSQIEPAPSSGSEQPGTSFLRTPSRHNVCIHSTLASAQCGTQTARPIHTCSGRRVHRCPSAGALGHCLLCFAFRI